MTTLPTDLDVSRQLMSVRASVIEATHHVRSPKRSTRYRTTRNLIIAGAAITALTAGAIVALQEPDEVISSYVTCYRTASLAEEPQYIGGAPGTSGEAIELCSWFWSNDMWSTEEYDPEGGDHPVPPLVACTGNDGIVAVFPRDGSEASDKDFCATLGLADWGSD